MDDQEKLVPQPAQEVIENSENINEELLEGVTGGTRTTRMINQVLQCFGCNRGIKFEKDSAPDPNKGEFLIHHPENGEPLPVGDAKDMWRNLHPGDWLDSPSHVRGARDTRTGTVYGIRTPNPLKQ
jgi:hypothetical protein